MKYYEISASSEPKIIGVNNGIYQLEIDEKALIKNDKYLEFEHCFSRKNINFWNQQEEIYKLMPPLIKGKMLKKAKITDIMGYAPAYRFLNYVYSERFLNILKVFNIGNYKVFDFEILNVPEKYNLLFIETIENESINFGCSSVITGHKTLNDIKRHMISNRQEYEQFLQNNPLGHFEKIAIPKKYFGRDIISIQANPNKFYSEKLVDFLLDVGINGLQVGYNNSIQLEFV